MCIQLIVTYNGNHPIGVRYETACCALPPSISRITPLFIEWERMYLQMDAASVVQLRTSSRSTRTRDDIGKAHMGNQKDRKRWMMLIMMTDKGMISRRVNADLATTATGLRKSHHLTSTNDFQDFPIYANTFLIKYAFCVVCYSFKPFCRER